MNRSRQAEEALIMGIGSQGTATLAIMLKMMEAFIAKGILTRVEVIEILDFAAEAAEEAPDELGGRYSKSTAASIRQMITLFDDSAVC
jgi:hypothetical protein